MYCVTRDEELASGTRVLATNNDDVAVLPYASHVPSASFARVPDRRLRSLAQMQQLVLGRLDATLGDPDLNLTPEDAAQALRSAATV